MNAKQISNKLVNTIKSAKAGVTIGENFVSTRVLDVQDKIACVFFGHLLSTEAEIKIRKQLKAEGYTIEDTKSGDLRVWNKAFDIAA